jgi:CheY-like chemotaxis protein
MSLKILLVEDHIINQKMTAALLKKLGFSVEVANNGKEAVEIFETDTYDAIIMDIQMPIMDGFEATALIRKKSNIPIIGLSGNPGADYEIQAERLRMEGCLKKPIDIDILTATLKLAIPSYR